jgi:hypothetical protein
MRCQPLPLNWLLRHFLHIIHLQLLPIKLLIQLIRINRQQAIPNISVYALRLEVLIEVVEKLGVVELFDLHEVLVQGAAV